MENIVRSCKTCLLGVVLIFNILLNQKLTTAKNNHSIINLASLGQEKADSSRAFLSAWNIACTSENPSTIYVPQGRYMVESALVFSGKNCKSKSINFVIRGTLVGPSDFLVLGDSGSWFAFEDVTGVSIFGGVFDGQGAGLWACKRSGKSCPTGVTTLRFTNSMNLEINGVTSLNSQLYHIVLDGCHYVKLEDVKISASGASPNTDGIHVQLSTGVTILNSNIATGDDCVSIGAGTNNLWIENMACGPGHGISIGSLGKDLNEPGVVNVTVKSATFTGTENGVRIKSWGRPSNGFVRNVLFQHLTMSNAQNPIIIDQNYCPDDKGCPGKVSGVRISDISYEDIHGSSATSVAITFNCSPEYHCTNIKLDGIDLTFNNQEAQSTCANIIGTSDGSIQPKICLAFGG